MTKEVAGISLESLEGPIRTALAEYSEITNGGVRFNTDQAAKLELTPEKSNSARSITDVTHNGIIATKLYVIAFGPQDGTGDESTYRLEDIDRGWYPQTPRVVPRSHPNIAAEAHLTIASRLIDEPNSDPVLFAGNLTLLSLVDRKITEVARLGQNTRHFTHSVWDAETAAPHATLTEGYWEGRTQQERFGDPRAVYNSWSQLVQVCGFIAVTPELAAKHDDIFEQLDAYEPIPTNPSAAK